MSASDVIASNKAPKNASVNVTKNKNSVNIEMKTYTLKEKKLSFAISTLLSKWLMNLRLDPA